MGLTEKTDEETSPKPRNKQRSKFDTQQNTLEKNPCMNEQNLSYKCLSENNYDKDVCALVFRNYKNCIEFWGKVRVHRRNHGIIPELPLPEHRQDVKNEFLKSQHLKK